MPPYTTLRDFISALATGDTNITRVLEQLANDATLRKDVNATASINKPNGFDDLPGWFSTACVQRGMNEDEVNHIAAWPNPQKETVRSQIAAAWSQNRPIHFSWELYEGDDALSELRRDPDSEVRIVFRSPRKGVHLDSRIRIGEVRVDV
jgi:hypothetical protein